MRIFNHIILWAPYTCEQGGSSTTPYHSGFNNKPIIISRLSADSETWCVVRAVIKWEDAVSCWLSVSVHCYGMFETVLINQFGPETPAYCSLTGTFFSSFSSFRCSRLYWSTVDPRRCCKYTCKVTEVSTPLPGEEQDPRWDQEENHTIVHSPSHHRGQHQLML